MTLRIIAAVLACITLGQREALAHEGPDPVAHWVFTDDATSGGTCHARLGPDLPLPRSARVGRDALGSFVDFTNEEEAPLRSGVVDEVPLLSFTVAAWVVIDEPEANGCLAAAIARGANQGTPPRVAWSLGYDESALVLTVTSAEGETTRVRSPQPYSVGSWIHVVGVCDGERLELYVNGELVAETPVDLGVQPSGTGWYVVGSGPDESTPSLRGRLREVSVYDVPARTEWVRHAFTSLGRLVSLQQDARPDALTFVVDPYLQHATTDAMTVMWRTTLKGTSVVHYGETDACDKVVSGDDAELHEVRIEGLQPATQYFYRVETADAAGQSLSSGVSTFSTAVPEGAPFAYAVISDTQLNPVVSGKLATLAWAQRPSFLLHPGDLVDTGVNDAHWVQHFFPGLRPLISHVPFFPVLGNHEQNASNYYEYVSVPDPEFYYDFRYGDAHFFMIDTNRNVGPGSEQHAWLDKALAGSKAKWKFACHHHPPYSSDEDDYGMLWKTNKSTLGDLRARQLSTLYEKHGVDVVWTGHIHSYERTWPVADGKARPSGGGPVYMIVGGGGGNLETAGPFRPYFQNNVRHGHHYVMAYLNGATLEVRSYDLEDRLFDTFVIEKR